jgi:putative tryptophan/tyrosine transport system substrate-binding protein
MFDKRRREFITVLGGAALAWPLAARAQQAGKVYRIGILETIPASQNAANLDALRKGLRELGYIEGQNLSIEYSSADGFAERFPELAGELVRLKVDLIVTRGTPAAQAAKNATAAIPVVMAAIGEPLGVGVVAGLARPSGNVTGLSSFTTELAGKRVELVKEMMPGISGVGLLHNMGNPVVPPQWEETQATARTLGLTAELLDVRSEQDVRAAFDAALRLRVGALLVGIDGLIQSNSQIIVDLAARHRLPAVYSSTEFVAAGGLMTYGISYPDLYFRAASFVDRIFKGAKPGDLPIQTPTKFELVINLKTAKALGLEVPPTLLARADEVIE